MNKLLILIFFLLSGCSITKYENVNIDTATFNDARWKSQAGVSGNADIEATTSPSTQADVGLNGL